tara:strand:+ start:48 stop:284 length:237 start_codon:yes stop_codon:yes gene_type:complete
MELKMKKLPLVQGVQNVGKMAVVAGTAFAANMSYAAIDTTAAVAEVDGAGTAIAAVGGAIISLAALAMAYRWVKATFF